MSYAIALSAYYLSLGALAYMFAMAVFIPLAHYLRGE
jgi:hypothetical protein